MLFLLDTNLVSDLLRNDARARFRFAALPSSTEVKVCPIIQGEILFGIEQLAPGRKRTDLKTHAESFFAKISCVPISEPASRRYSEIKCILRKAGRPCGENDLWIAACALDIGAVLVTRDLAFQNVPGLVTEDWTK